VFVRTLTADFASYHDLAAMVRMYGKGEKRPEKQNSTFGMIFPPYFTEKLVA
jgi:hypothetical protein